LQTYFISNGVHVKIGKSTYPKERFKSLQTASFLPLQILAIVDGDIEQNLHRRFEKYRVKGEWFELSNELREFIASLTPYPEKLVTTRKKKYRKILEYPPGKKHGWHIVTDETKAKWQVHWKQKREAKWQALRSKNTSGAAQ
jgi:hypothetical protein